MKLIHTILPEGSWLVAPCSECGAPENAYHHSYCETAAFIRARSRLEDNRPMLDHSLHVEMGYCAHVRDFREAWCLREAQHLGEHMAVLEFEHQTNKQTRVWPDEAGVYLYHTKEDAIFGHGSPRKYVHSGEEAVTFTAPRGEFTTITAHPGDTVTLHGAVKPVEASAGTHDTDGVVDLAPFVGCVVDIPPHDDDDALLVSGSWPVDMSRAVPFPTDDAPERLMVMVPYESPETIPEVGEYVRYSIKTDPYRVERIQHESGASAFVVTLIPVTEAERHSLTRPMSKPLRRIL